MAVMFHSALSDVAICARSRINFAYMIGTRPIISKSDNIPVQFRGEDERIRLSEA